jgi:hypothetical protein
MFVPKAATTLRSSTRPVTPNYLLQAIERQGMYHAALSTGHSFRHTERIEDRLLGGLGGSVEDVGHRIGVGHQDVNDFVLLVDMVCCREGDEDVTAAVGANTTDRCAAASDSVVASTKHGNDLGSRVVS